MILEATAPTRIDLAGGTLDIYPLYLFEEGGVTLNAAINLKSVVRIKVRDDKRVRIFSEDLQEKREAEAVEALETGGPLDLVVRVIKFYASHHGLDVVTKSSVPAGSGLGASSSLLIALSAALNRILGNKYSKDDLIQLGANLEAQSIRIPTGKQDYYPAAFGGVNCLWFGIEHTRVEPLELDDGTMDQLNQRLVLSYTGASRASATSNWNMIKMYIDQVGTTVHQMQGIKATALAMREALLQGNLDAFAELLAKEWENRKLLADGVTTPPIDRLVSSAAKAGALASKVCGAGGGGCMISFVRPGTRDSVVSALENAGAEVLAFAIDTSGVRVRQSR